MADENQEKYDIEFESADGVIECRKVIRRLSKGELQAYINIGSGAGPIALAVSSGIKHCKNFAERVVGYTVSKEGIGSMVKDALKEVLPNHPQAMGEVYTYTFYEDKYSEKISSVNLFTEKTGNNSRWEDVNIGDNGDFRADRQDMGPSTLDEWGDGDCEWWCKVDRDWKDTILLLLAKERFKGMADIEEWLKAKKIPFEKGCY